jgi:flagellar hook protein FlgE
MKYTPATDDEEANYELIYPGDGDEYNDDTLSYAQMDSISIDGTTGKITGICKETDEYVTIGYIAIGNVTNPNGVTQESGSYYSAGEGAGDLTVTMLGGIASDLGLTYIGATTTAAADGQQQGGDDDTTTDTAGMQILSAGTTELITGGLESSKTDLATEISEMITTQRGYQANTRIITVTDSMLEELVNMKR